MDAAIFVTMLTGFFLGFVCAFTEYRHRTVKQNRAHRRKLQETDRLAFIDGWNAALEDRDAVRIAFEKLNITYR